MAKEARVADFKLPHKHRFGVLQEFDRVPGSQNPPEQ